ncbi:MAG: hypothetical protein ACOX8W_07100 [bacterium]
MLKTVLFDLDGTLLPLDTAQFINEYLQSVARAARATPGAGDQPGFPGVSHPRTHALGRHRPHAMGTYHQL